jgi:hypothetical protein
LSVGSTTKPKLFVGFIEDTRSRAGDKWPFEGRSDAARAVAVGPTLVPVFGVGEIGVLLW